MLGRIIDADGGNDHALDGTPAGVGALEWEPAHRPDRARARLPGLGDRLRHEELWPGTGFLDQQLLDLRLAADGETNLGETACGATAAPTGEPVLATGTQDVYGRTVDFLRSIQPDSRVYAWDWRRSPADALAGLDLEIERARCRGTLPPGATTCARAAHDHVVLMGHGMGGLLVQRLHRRPRAGGEGRPRADRRHPLLGLAEGDAPARRRDRRRRGRSGSTRCSTTTRCASSRATSPGSTRCGRRRATGRG